MSTVKITETMDPTKGPCVFCGQEVHVGVGKDDPTNGSVQVQVVFDGFKPLSVEHLDPASFTIQMKNGPALVQRKAGDQLLFQHATCHMPKFPSAEYLAHQLGA